MVEIDEDTLHRVSRELQYRVIVLGENAGLDPEVLRTEVLHLTKKAYDRIGGRYNGFVLPYAAPFHKYASSVPLVGILTDRLVASFSQLTTAEVRSIMGTGAAEPVPYIATEYLRDLQRIDASVILSYRGALDKLTPMGLAYKIRSETGLSALMSRLAVWKILGVTTKATGKRCTEGRRKVGSDVPLLVPTRGMASLVRGRVHGGMTCTEAVKGTGWSTAEILPYVGVYTRQRIPKGVLLTAGKSVIVSTPRNASETAHEKMHRGGAVEIPKSGTVTGGLWPHNVTVKHVQGPTEVAGVSLISAEAHEYTAAVTDEHERHYSVNEVLRAATVARAEAIGAASRKDTAAAEEARCVWKQAVMDLDLMGFDFDAAQDVLEDDDKWKARMAAATTHESRWSRFKRWCRQWL